MPVTLGASSGGAFPQLTITQSQTWVPPQDGNVCIHLVGAGGGAFGGSQLTPRGGGAGAYAKIPTLAVTTSGSYTLVVGVGGVGGGFADNGITGGNSTIAGTGLTGTKTAGGGAGGASSATANGGTVSGSGESWAGFTGGAGKYSGGAVGIYATGMVGGTTAGYGGQSNPTELYANMGGTTDAASGGLAMSGYGIICGGNEKSYAQTWTQSFTPNIQFVAGDLCGGGGVYTTQGYRYIRGANGGIGGGGGGAQSATGTAAGNPYSYGGAGGDGIILIQYLPW